MMHAQHALSWLESFELREYQHSQRTKAVNAPKAQTFNFADPAINCSARRTAVNRGSSLMTRNEGLQGSASIAGAIELRPQPALEPNISPRAV